MTVISYRDLPLLMRRNARQIENASIRTLNTVAFQSLPELVAEAQERMKFRNNARAALGWQVDKATPGNAKVVIQTRRKWLKQHLQEGTRSPQSGGFIFQGREFILVPVLKEAFGKGGVMKAGYLANFYVVPHGDGGLVFYRARRGEKQSKLIAVLKPTVATHEDTEPQKVINAKWQSQATRLLRSYLRNPGFRA